MSRRFDNLPLRQLAAGVTAGLVLGGCALAVEPGGGDVGKLEQAESWDWTNNPSRFGGTMVTELAQLPSEGRAERAAWPSSYWPTYRNSIADRWNGNELSPAEKYDVAFNGWTPQEGFMELRPFEPSSYACDSGWDSEYYAQLGPLADYVSRNMGNRRARDGVDSDGDGEVDECDDHDGVETWWGLCHAWVPAALLEPAPQRSVEYNGVVFHPGDMEALLIAAYNRAGADMIGGRCNVGNEASNPVERDEHGRAIDSDCRDSNPGSLHIILTNFLGIQRRGFAEDRTFDYEVWNQPVVAYEITRQQEITVPRAHELLGQTGDTYVYNHGAARLYDVRATVTYITESHASTTPADPSRYERNDYYSYILEVDSNGDVIGGEWYGASRSRHPDFLWSPRPITRSSVPSLDIDDVRMLIDMSREPEDPEDPGDGYEVRSNLPIPDNNPSGVSSSLNVPDSGTISSLSVELDITHTYISDLRVTLSHNGIEHVIHNHSGGSSDDIRDTFAVPGFEGMAVNGEWTVHIVDGASRDVGTLNRWRLITELTGGGGDDPGGEEVTAVGEGGISIPDNTPTGITSSAVVSESLSVDRVEVDLRVTHTYVGDLVVTLSHGGTERVIHNRSGGSSDNIDATIEVSGFAGVDGSGEWVLRVKDLAGQDVGTLDSWTLRLFPGEGGGGGGGGGGGSTDPEAFPGEGGIDIPDNNATGITSVAEVPTSVASGSVAISVNITHTWRGDLTVGVGHGSQSWTLHDQAGGSADNLVQTFTLSGFSGSPAGTWELHVSDNAGQDTGRLVSWSVVVTP